MITEIDENKFVEVMQKQPDLKLLRMVTNDRKHYDPLAIEAAEMELTKRNIDFTPEHIDKDVTENPFFRKEVEDYLRVPSSTRFTHWVIDTIACFIIAIIAQYIILSLFILIQDQIASEEKLQQATILFSVLPTLLAFVGYYYFMESKYQQTLGKMLTKTLVVNKWGDKPTSGDIIKRTLFRIIPFEYLSFLVTKNGLHDSLSDTIVIRKRINPIN